METFNYVCNMRNQKIQKPSELYGKYFVLYILIVQIDLSDEFPVQLSPVR